MQVSPQSARLAACVGTNLNNDGILLYEAMAVLFVAQVHGLDLSLTQQLVAAFGCIVAGVGISGIPDAGLISLTVVLTTVGLPIEIVPLLFTVDWLVGRARAMTNVVSDMLVAVLLDKTRNHPRGFAPRTPLHALSRGPRGPAPFAWLASLRSLAECSDTHFRIRSSTSPSFLISSP